jgi:hypothetical protein
MHAAKKYYVTANVVPSSPILLTLTMEAIRSSETSVLIRAIRRNTYIFIQLLLYGIYSVANA